MARLDLRWTGRPPDAERFHGVARRAVGRGRGRDHPCGDRAARRRDLVQRRPGRIGVRPAAGSPDRGGAAARSRRPWRLEIGSRPELYDFDLFDLPEESLASQDRRLSDLAYTVFDTETTGFDPAGGDEIVSIGAVRVVNGRLLRHETFERLVDPRRSVPARSVAVHGITTDMLRGQPTMDEVLPLFARFAEDTVLVGTQRGLRHELPAREGGPDRGASDPAGSRHAAARRRPSPRSRATTRSRPSPPASASGCVGRHTALGDALLTAEVFVRLLTLLQQRGIRTLGEALAASRATYQARLDARLYGG